MLASQSTNSGFTSDHVDSIWQLTSIDNPGRTGRKQYTTVAQLPQPGHRRGWTEGTKRMSIFKTRSRSNTTVNLAMGYQLSPASSAKPSESLYQIPENRPQSGWSDSDRSDSFTKGKSWVLKGSRILKKQNSKFNLSSARTMDWVTKYDESADVSNGYLPREHKHTRVWSDVDSASTRPIISKPYNFQHLTHTQAHQFQELERASYNDLMTEFSAIRASQAPRRELQGIRAEDLLRSPVSASSRPVWEDSLTPPMMSPTKAPASRNGSIVSFRDQRSGRDSHVLDNFSQPSPKMYKGPNPPTSPPPPPPRTSSRNASISAPDFFTDYHQDPLIGSESCGIGFGSKNAQVQETVLSTTTQEWDEIFNASNLPHAITTPNDMALTLPPTAPRNSLTGVSEEGENGAYRRASVENNHRPATAGSLRHAKSFPSARSPAHRRNVSSSSDMSIGRRDSLPIEGLTLNDSLLPLEDQLFDDIPLRSRVSRRISLVRRSTDACWEDDIDYCYEHEAEADCDFDWDRISINGQKDTDNNDDGQLTSKRDSRVMPDLKASRLVDRCCPKLDTSANTAAETCNKLASLETSVPELEYSTASSAKSSMASLRGPVTPSQPLMSSQKFGSSTGSPKNVERVSLGSSFLVPQDYEMQWIQEDLYQSILASDRNSDYHCSLQNFCLHTWTSKDTSPRSSGSPISKCNSSESIMLSQSGLSVQRRRCAESNVSLPDLVPSKVSHPDSGIQVGQSTNTGSSVNKEPMDTKTVVAVHPRRTNLAKEVVRPSLFKKTSSSLNGFISDEQLDEDEAPVILPPLQPRDRSNSGSSSLASRIRSGSVATSGSSSSSKRTSRISYSLFPTVNPTKNTF